jgi:hypothetical protein
MFIVNAKWNVTRGGVVPTKPREVQSTRNKVSSQSSLADDMLLAFLISSGYRPAFLQSFFMPGYSYFN